MIPIAEAFIRFMIYPRWLSRDGRRARNEVSPESSYLRRPPPPPCPPPPDLPDVPPPDDLPLELEVEREELDREVADRVDPEPVR